MFTKDQLQKFTLTLLELQRDNFIQLLHNAEFRSNAVDKQELAVEYITELFRHELQENMDDFIKTDKN